MVELQILGHLILFVLCVLTVVVAQSKTLNYVHPDAIRSAFLMGFVPLEIIYWGLHWYFVGPLFMVSLSQQYHFS